MKHGKSYERVSSVPSSVTFQRILRGIHVYGCPRATAKPSEERVRERKR